IFGIAVYWGSIVVAVAVARLGIRAVQKALILRGHGLHKAVVVGWSERVEALYREVARYPAAGLQIVGAVRLHNPAYVTVPTRTEAGAAGEPLLEAAPSRSEERRVGREG